MEREKFVGIIPARYASSRLPGKPLLEIGGRPVIQHVYESASKVLPGRVVVATDDERILRAVEAFGGKAVMTSPDHPSGTDRVREAYAKSGIKADVVINIQGDEPFVSVNQITGIMAAFEDEGVDIATTVIPMSETNSSPDELRNPNNVKAVRASDGRVIYFSRSVVPFSRDLQENELLASGRYFKHLGMYAYRTTVLEKITRLPESPLEKIEKLEQLRWLEAGYRIQAVVSEEKTIGIDTPKDLEEAKAFYEKRLTDD